VFDLGTGPYNIIKWNPQASPLHTHKLVFSS